jgi:hypothetical protein
MKTLFKSLYLCLLTASTLNIYAQNCSISGRIYSSETKKGILQASLLILDEEGAMVTGISSGFNGRYSTDSLPSGLYYLNVRAAGFENIERLPLRLLGKNSNIDLAMLNTKDAKKEKSETKKEATVMPAIFQAALNLSSN